MQSSVPLCVTLKNAGGNMKIKNCVNGIELTLNDEMIFICTNEMIENKILTKGRVDSFCETSEQRYFVYTAISEYLKALVKMVEDLNND